MHGGTQHQVLTATELAIHRMMGMYRLMMMCMMFSRSLGAAQAVFVIHDRLHLNISSIMFKVTLFLTTRQVTEKI